MAGSSTSTELRNPNSFPAGDDPRVPTRVLGDPANWSPGVWYVRRPGGYVASEDQDPKNNVDSGIFVQWDGHVWQIYGAGPSDFPGTSTDTTPINYVQEQRLDDGTVLTTALYPPGAEFTVPPGAYQIPTDNGTIVLSRSDGQDATPPGKEAPEPPAGDAGNSTPPPADSAPADPQLPTDDTTGTEAGTDGGAENGDAGGGDIEGGGGGGGDIEGGGGGGGDIEGGGGGGGDIEGGGGGGGEACFVGSTPVRMADGTTRPIANIAAGDRVMTAQGKSAVVWRVDANTVRDTVDIRLSTGERITTTENHRFGTSSGAFVSAARMSLASPFTSGATAERKAVAPSGITRQRVPPTRMYNLSLVGGDTFLVGTSGIVTHLMKENPRPGEDDEGDDLVAGSQA